MRSRIVLKNWTKSITKWKTGKMSCRAKESKELNSLHVVSFIVCGKCCRIAQIMMHDDSSEMMFGKGERMFVVWLSDILMLCLSVTDLLPFSSWLPPCSNVSYASIWTVVIHLMGAKIPIATLIKRKIYRLHSYLFLRTVKYEIDHFHNVAFCF